MRRSRRDQVAALESALREAERRAPIVRARYDELIAAVVRAKGDPSAVLRGGAALEEIRRGKLYRLDGHRTMDALLASLGVGRTTAHKWRVLARSSSADAIAIEGRERAYHVSRPNRSGASKSARSIGAGVARIAGVKPRVASRIERGVPLVAVELPVDVWRSVIARVPATSQ